MGDELTGLTYLRARYYNPATGRFTQEDVIYDDGFNLYAYCGSNPVIYCDSSGFSKCDVNDPTSGNNNGFELPGIVKSGKGVEGEFSKNGYRYRIDTNKVAPGEGGFHIHIYRKNKEIAKITGRGGYVKMHKGKFLLSPSQMDKTVRKEINKLVGYVRKKL